MSRRPRVDPQTKLLHDAVAISATQGWTVVMLSPPMATLSRPVPIHHLLHALLTLLTGGLWAIVWVVVAVTNKPRTMMLTVEDDDRVWWTADGERHPWAP